VTLHHRFSGRQLWLCFAVAIVFVALLLALSRFLPSPYSGLSMEDLKHNPWLADHPTPVKVDIRTFPPRMTVHYRLGWETVNSRPRKRIYKFDAEGSAAGVTPLTLRLVDKGYSHVAIEFRRGDNVFTKTYPTVPTVIEADFSHDMRYPRLHRDVPAAPSAPDSPPLPR
jgi:hypothetical protein